MSSAYFAVLNEETRLTAGFFICVQNLIDRLG
jgi:hypothetical protein